MNELSYTICDTLCVTMSSEIDHIDPSTNLFDDAIVIGPLPLKTPQNPSHHGEVQNEKFPPAQLNILVASMQLDPPLWDNIFHERFFENLLQAMRRFGHHKFLIKEKKGELTALPKSLLSNLISQPNCQIVWGKNPKNKSGLAFEDYLKTCDMVISQAPNSMTILEARLHDKITLVYDQFEEESFWRHFKNEIYFGIDISKLIDSAANYRRAENQKLKKSLSVIAIDKLAENISLKLSS